MEKLPKAFKKKWVAALRSGKYTQASGELYNTFFDDEDNPYDGYCCLGVAEKIMGTDLNTMVGLGEPSQLKGLSKVPKILRQPCQNTEVPWKDKNIVSKLISMNDDKNWSFNKIASYIERYL